jgi:dihydropyrimidinase
MCENPARIFGLYPQKGVIHPGSDADLVLFDPNVEESITNASQHSNATYTAYEGMTVRGAPILTMQRGVILVENGETRARAGHGCFLRTNSGHATIAELQELRQPA